MILWINVGNHIMDANKKGANLSPRFVSGKLVSVNYSTSQMTLSMVDGEESFKLRPESRMFRVSRYGGWYSSDNCHMQGGRSQLISMSTKIRKPRGVG